MGNHDYYNVDVPEAKDPEDYTYVERRGEILSLILKRGSPQGINQSRLADRYDVSESQISQDMSRLREHVERTLGQHAKMTTRAVYQETLQKLKEEGEWKKRWDVVMEWNEWLGDLGIQEREPDKHEISGELTSEHSEKKMLVGVDLDSFPDVDPSRMVGVDLREEDQPAAPAEEAAAAIEPGGEPGEVEVEAVEPDSEGGNPGGNAEDNGGSEQ